MLTRTILFTTALTGANAFSVVPSGRPTTQLNGLFDGVKEAFSAPALERSRIESERETPIDRWMGWSVVSEKEQQENEAAIAGKWVLFRTRQLSVFKHV